MAHFIETIKARLQLQYSLAAVPPSAGSKPSSAASPLPRHTMPLAAPSGARSMHTATAASPTAGAIHYSGPIDVIKQTVAHKGILGMWRGFGATIMFRANFAVSPSPRGSAKRMLTLFVIASGCLEVCSVAHRLPHSHILIRPWHTRFRDLPPRLRRVERHPIRDVSGCS